MDPGIWIRIKNATNPKQGSSRENSVERQWGKTTGKEKDEDREERKKKTVGRYRGKQ
jgi:hypothetical protein